jgi:poly-gamma-glutamate synthase PgsB/CapB
MIYLLLSLLSLLVYLAGERYLLERRIRSIPLRITVTGTRGKSSVARLLTSVLREDGRRVVAKTTGSRAMYILPDGSEDEVPRRGVTSIIEQKKLIRLAARLNADCMIAEIMSLHPENHTVESKELIKPHVVVVTNVRVDHVDAMGSSEDQVASIYGLDIPDGAKVMIPETEMREPFERAAYRASADLMVIPDGSAFEKRRGNGGMEGLNFVENLDLVRSVAGVLAVDDKVIERGLKSSKGDVGAMKIWKYTGDGGKECFLVNGFAANDPESTSRILTLLPDILPSMSGKPIGLLSLRADRGDRTLHWIKALRAGLSDCFSRLYVMGPHSAAVCRKLNGIETLKNGNPRRVMQVLTADVEDGTVIVGMGNYVGRGEEMISFWQSIGTEYGL